MESLLGKKEVKSDIMEDPAQKGGKKGEGREGGWEGRPQAVARQPLKDSAH